MQYNTRLVAGPTSQYWMNVQRDATIVTPQKVTGCMACLLDTITQ